MDLEILDYSIYGNPCDCDSDRLLVEAARREGLSACVTALTRETTMAPQADRAWLRYDLRSLEELRWMVNLAKQLEDACTCVFPTARSLLMSEDKWETYQALCQAGVATVKTFPCSQISRCGSRAVVKPRVGWGGMGMRILDDAACFERGKNETDDACICQPYIDHERIWTLAVAAGEVLTCIEKYSGVADFRTNELQGGTTQLRPPPQGGEALALAALRTVDLPVGTVDIIMDTEGIEVLEVNSAPGLFYPGMPQLDLAGPMLRAVLSRIGQP